MNLFSFKSCCFFSCFFSPSGPVPGTVRGFNFTRNIGICLISWQHYMVFIRIELAKGAGNFYVDSIRKHI
jgi:hypothetical protein